MVTSKVVGKKPVAEQGRGKQAVVLAIVRVRRCTGRAARQWIAGRGQQTGNMELKSI
jgi:hypothetical protein